MDNPKPTPTPRLRVKYFMNEEGQTVPGRSETDRDLDSTSTASASAPIVRPKAKKKDTSTRPLPMTSVVPQFPPEPVRHQRTPNTFTLRELERLGPDHSPFKPDECLIAVVRTNCPGSSTEVIVSSTGHQELGRAPVHTVIVHSKNSSTTSDPPKIHSLHTTHDVFFRQCNNHFVGHWIGCTILPCDNPIGQPADDTPEPTPGPPKYKHRALIATVTYDKTNPAEAEQTRQQKKNSKPPKKSKKQTHIRFTELTRTMNCYHCGKPGHFARVCHSNPHFTTFYRGGGRGRSRGFNRGGRGGGYNNRPGGNYQGQAYGHGGPQGQGRGQQQQQQGSQHPQQNLPVPQMTQSTSGYWTQNQGQGYELHPGTEY